MEIRRSLLIVLFAGGGLGSSLPVGIKACRRRCGERGAAGRPGRLPAPPVGVGGAERAGRRGGDPGPGRTVGDRVPTSVSSLCWKH